MRADITSLTRAVATTTMHDLTATIHRATFTTPTSPLDTPVESWDDAELVASTAAGLQAASKDAQEAFGVTYQADRYRIFLDPIDVPIAPVTHRVHLGDREFAIVRARRWPSHIEILADELNTTEDQS